MPVHRHIGLCLVIVLNPAELPFAAAGSPTAPRGSPAMDRGRSRPTSRWVTSGARDLVQRSLYVEAIASLSEELAEMLRPQELPSLCTPCSSLNRVPARVVPISTAVSRGQTPSTCSKPDVQGCRSIFGTPWIPLPGAA